MITDIKLIKEGHTIFDQGDERYVIPLYQRAFAWGTEHYSNRENEIIQLMDDVTSINGEGDYYLGSLIVFRRRDQDPAVYEVIDGQQRLTALYLIFSCLGCEIRKSKALSYDCRPQADYALENIDVLKKDTERLEKPYDSGIYLGIKTIQRKIEVESKSDAGYSDKLKTALEHVHLFRIEVPECTDLNRYFEIMNTRGEQLEQHDIVKASLMEPLDHRRREVFAEIWNACSDMNGCVQMHFDPQRRDLLFGSHWNEIYISSLLHPSAAVENATGNRLSIQQVVQENFRINIADEIADNDERIRFESIIDFRHFLLHVLKVFIACENIVNDNPEEKLIDDLLDDRKLILSFYRVRKNGRINGNNIDPRDFSWKFMCCLLHCRFLFDKYIIKREYREENSDGEWSLQEMNTSGARAQKKAYYVQTNFCGFYQRRDDSRTRCNKMIQACLRVSFTSPKNMHWITELLKWAKSKSTNGSLNNPEGFETEAQKIAVDAVRPFLQSGDYQQGVNTPHIVFNYLDFLLWKQSIQNNIDERFNFEFRNSVEHWYPQHPTTESEGCPQWNADDGHGTVDRFGNLAILPASINSRFSNQTPKGKIGYEANIKNGSLKLRRMAAAMNDVHVTSEMWRTDICERHEKEMLDILRNACDGLSQDVAAH